MQMFASGEAKICHLFFKPQTPLPGLSSVWRQKSECLVTATPRCVPLRLGVFAFKNLTAWIRLHPIPARRVRLSSSRQGQPEISPAFQRRVACVKGMSPARTAETHYHKYRSSYSMGCFSAVPAGLWQCGTFPGVETPGYCQSSLRDSRCKRTIFKSPRGSVRSSGNTTRLLTSAAPITPSQLCRSIQPAAPV